MTGKIGAGHRLKGILGGAIHSNHQLIALLIWYHNHLIANGSISERGLNEAQRIVT